MKNNTLLKQLENENGVYDTEVNNDVAVKNAVTKFMYFANNYPPNWIFKIWKSTNMMNHLTDKWHELNARNQYGGTINFFKFFMELDNTNKLILTSWIDKNYSETIKNI